MISGSDSFDQTMPVTAVGAVSGCGREEIEGKGQLVTPGLFRDRQLMSLRRRKRPVGIVQQIARYPKGLAMSACGRKADLV